MGRVTDRLPGPEQTAEDPSRVPAPADAAPVEAPEEAPEDTLTRLQSTVGNGAMASVVGPPPDPPASPSDAPPALSPSDAPPAPEPVPDPVPEGEPPAAPDSGADQLDTSMLELVDAELVEHERWAAAGAEVGGTGSAARADFIAAEVGGGMGDSVGTAMAVSFGTTTALQAVEEALPGIGQVVGGVFAAKAIADGALGRDFGQISHFGEGSDDYEKAANDIEGICAVLDIASNIVNVLAGVVGIVALAATAAAFATFGALSPLAVAAGEIALAFGAAGAVLAGVKMAVQPLVVLFRSLHTFTSEADPRDIEAQGHVLEEGGKEIGGALGGLAGGAAGGLLKGGAHETPESPPPSTPDTPTPAAPGELTIEAEPAGDVWPEEYNVPYPPEEPLHVDLPPERADAMLDLAESGDVRGFHTDEDLFDLEQDAAGRRRPGPDMGPRAEFNKLRDRMDLPEDWQGPIHHEQYPMRDYPDRALDPDNLYATRTGSTAHQDFHAAFGETGRPYRQMAEGFEEPGIQHTFDFANTAPPPPEPTVIIDEAALGLQPGEVEVTQGPPPGPPARKTDVDWADPRVREALGLDPVTGEPTGAKLDKPGQLEVDPAQRPWDEDEPAPGPYHGSLGMVKNGEYAPESYFQVTEQDGYAVRVGPPGAFVDHVFPTQEEAEAYAAEVASRGEAAIRSTSALPHEWPGKYDGNPVDEVRILAVPAGTPTLTSAVAPQPETLSTRWGPKSYAGGGPQTQLPKGLFPRGATPDEPSPAQVGEPVPIPERAENWFVRMQRYPGEARATELREQGEALATSTGPAERAHLGKEVGELAEAGGAPGEPVVERVDPQYQPPPGTQADIDRLTADIERTLAVRRQAERDRDHAGAVAEAARTQGAQVQQARDDVTATLAANQEHQDAVRQRLSANERSATQHEEGGAKIQDADTRLAGVATLETLLAGWSGFTGVVLKFSAVLPDRAVNAFNKMNTDSTEFMAKLAHVKTEVAGQQGAQPARGAQIDATGARITATGAQAEGTQEGLLQSQQRGAELASLNQQHVATAVQDQTAAATQASQADTVATGLTAQRETLAASMAAWAAAHRAARRAAVEEAERRLTARGLRVTRKPD